MKKEKYVVVVLLLNCLIFAHAADKFAPVGNTLASTMQWLAVHTACLGAYNMAQVDYLQPDPRDYYQAPDIREYLARQSGNRTVTRAFYGICFDYAQFAYNAISTSQSYYENLGMKRGEFYIAAALESSRQIVLFKPVAQGQHSMVLNGEYVKEISRQNVQAHGSATKHGWLWVYGNDGTIYWIDPTWTDNSGYIWWGVIRNGREEQVAPESRLCAARLPSNDAFASFSSGDAKKNSGRYDEAIEDYDQAIRVEPNYAKAYNNRGLAYYHKHDYDRAIAEFNQAITLDPNYADAYNNRGLAYYAKRDMDKALADYDQAIKLDSTFALAYNGRAYVYLVKGDRERAVADVNQAIRLNPGEATWYATRGEIFIDLKMYDRAIMELELALRMSPGYPYANELLQRARRRGR